MATADAKVIWKYDMIEEVGSSPHNMSNSSPVSYGDLMFAGTANGQDESHVHIPSPRAPSMIALNKKTGKKVWEVNNVGERILHGQWSSPAVGKIGDVVQVVMGEGDGWVRGYEAETGKKLWEFDLNPKDSVWPKTRNEVIATPVIWENKVFIANGQDPEHGEGVGHLYAIDATKRGDITETGRLWHYDKIRRSISTGAIYNGLLFYSDFSGFLHCLDVNTGKPYWTHDHAVGRVGIAHGDQRQGLPGRRRRRRVRARSGQGEEADLADQHGQFGVCDGGAGQRHAVHHEPQRAVGAQSENECRSLSTCAPASCSANAALTNSARWRKSLGFTRTLIGFRSRPGRPQAIPAQAPALLAEAGIAAYAFHDFSPNPDTEMVEAGRVFAAAHAHRLTGRAWAAAVRSIAPRASTSS